MSQESTFTIYNASAGSGKTFTLVKAYLTLLFKSKNPLAFRNILALTFTNKAVAEMKQRIVSTLKEFADERILNNDNAMFNTLVNELSVSPAALHTKSKQLLNIIVHNYAAFDISTIDKFNHNLIRTFAHDLKLPLNFEVEIDSATLLARAVDNLIDKAGTDDQLTKVLIDFAIEKADEDKSWDVSRDFYSIAQLLVKESEIETIETIKDKSLDDFKKLKTAIGTQLKLTEKQLIDTANDALSLITGNGLDFSDFSGGYLPKFFQKSANGDFGLSFGLAWQQKLIDGEKLYNKTAPQSVGSIIDGIQPQIAEHFNTLKTQTAYHNFLKNAYNNITPVSVLNAIYQSLKAIKDDEDLILISEFNNIIHNEIKGQPTPFIYERTGEKFRHFFIDEFQDTSVMQWKNMLPLIDNALSGENAKGETGSAMIVGDAKQAIYRWRGGKAEQFIDLYTKEEKPFQTDAKVNNLPDNYRSLKTIVTFNNQFFQHLSETVFSASKYQEIYKKSSQNIRLKEEGYVELSFLEKTDDEPIDELYCKKVLNIIKTAEANGFSLGDICVIVRKSKEGVAIAEYLSKQEIHIVSSESLLIKNAPEVQFITNCIALASQPENALLKMGVLNYLADYRLKPEDKHTFFDSLIHLEASKLFEKLNDYGCHFDFNSFLQLPLYEAVETIIRQFKLNKTSNAYLQFFLDEVLEYSQKNNPDFAGFTAHWDIKKDKQSIVAPQNTNAVQIMTIHKSKGLEFPVVIFPFANQDIYFDILPKTWFPVDKNRFEGFSYLYANMNDNLKEVNDEGKKLRETYISEQELDSINLLYVVLTRAVEHLYIVSEYDVDAKNEEKTKLYSGLFISYLKKQNLWNSDQKVYTFGQQKKVLKTKETAAVVIQEHFISVAKETHKLNIVTNSGYLWDTEQERAIEKGNLVHLLLSQIKTDNDITYTFEHFLQSGTINHHQAETLRPVVESIVNHPKLQMYFKPELTVYNEKDIITANGLIVRPDKLVIDTKNNAIIMDYKTGVVNPAHKEQLNTYQSVIEEMHFTVTKKILVYINDTLEIIEF